MGGVLEIWVENKKKESLVSICWHDLPSPLRLLKKNRAKMFNFRAIPGLGGEDGFQAYITAKGC